MTSANDSAGITAKIVLTMILLMCVPWHTTEAAAGHYRVLVLNTFNQSLPVNTDWHRGMVRGFKTAPDTRIDFDIEALDLVSVSDPGYVSNLVELLRAKYTGATPDLIIPTYTQAYKFILDHGEEIFPGVPIVFCGADSAFVAGRRRPLNATGVTTYRDIAGTAKLVLKIQPNARQLAVVVGSHPLDLDFDRLAQRELKSIEGLIELVWLRGLPLDDLLAAIQTLPPDTPILYLIEITDRTGESQYPFYTTSRLMEVANAPVYGLWDTLIGNGILGGRLMTVEEDGFLAAQMALRVLRGESPATIPVVVRTANPAILDGRQLGRWNIDVNRLPDDVQIRYRPLSAWEEHRTGILTGIFVIVIQALLILALVFNHRKLQGTQTILTKEFGRRIQAETIAARLRARLGRFSKERSLGTMATAISHEVNQPLIAIQNYAQAAKRRLREDEVDRPKLTELFAKIEGQAERAGSITQRVRSLVNRSEVELKPVAPRALIEEVVQLMEAEATSRECRIDYRDVSDLPPVLADYLEIQLVLVNLLQNAMQAVVSTEHFDRRIFVEGERSNEQEFMISVRDRGPGVDPDRVAEIFEPLYSSAGGGMGMGLAICQAIIEAHGGRIWYEPDPAGGAIFRFTLRIAGS